MISLTDFIAQEMRRLHRVFERAVADLTDQDWHFIPANYNNSIAFALWHATRTEDNIVRFVLQERRPTVWMEQGYAEKLGLHPTQQGTGMPPEDARAFCITDTGLFMEYARAAWASTDDYLGSPDAAAFERLVTVRPLGEMPAARALGQVVMTHSFQHLGEVDALRTMMGKPSAVGV
jgi:DinB family protein